MKVVRSQANLEATVIIQLSEKEARALDSFAYLGAHTPTLDFINKNWGNDIKREDIISLFGTAHGEISPHLKKIDEARKIFNKE